MMRTRKLIAVLAAACLALTLIAYLDALASAGHEPSAIVSLEHYRDASGTQTVADVARAPFEPQDPDFHGGYDRAPHWFRLVVSPKAEPLDIVLELSFNLLDRVTLYRPDGTGWTATETGDAVPLAQRDYRLTPLGFLLSTKDFDKPLYLKVQTSSSLAFSLRTRTRVLAAHEVAHRIALHVIYFALLGMGILLSALRLRLVPDRLSVSMFGLMAIYLGYSVDALGYGPALIPFGTADLHNHIGQFSAVLTVLASMLFHRFYLGSLRPHRYILAFCDAIILAQTLVLIPLIGGRGDVVGQPSLVLSLLGLGSVLAMLVTVRVEDPAQRRALYSIYVTWLVVTTLWITSHLGLISLSAFSRPFVELYGLNSLFLVLSIMAVDHSNRLRQQRQTQLALVTARATQQANARNAAIEDSFMHMLMHELRNNLTILKISLPDLPPSAARSDLAAAIRDLDRPLVEARHATMLANGTWQPMPRPNLLVEALDRAIESIDGAERVDLDGDEAELAVHADDGMLSAMLSSCLGALLRLAPPDGRIRVTLSRKGSRACCRLDSTAPDPRDEVGAEFTLASMLISEMGGTLALHRSAPDRIEITLDFPASLPPAGPSDADQTERTMP